jgi:hypothetical protein
MRNFPENWVYFIERPNGDIKIGVARKVRLTKRMAEIKRKHGGAILLGVIEGDYELEKELHERFIEYRQTVTYRAGHKKFNIQATVYCEFFSPVDELLEFIKQNTNPVPEISNSNEAV